MRITVHAKTRAHANQVIQTAEDTYTVLTTSIPENGKANEAILNLLARYIGIAPSRLRIILGKTSREKLIEVTD